MDTYTLGKTPLDEESARRRGVYLYNTQNLQETGSRAPSRVQTRNSSKRGAAHLRLKPHGHRDRP